ncbi:MAG: FAD-dependent oxidoreductase [Saprospiraceae bacterium]|nr:FAD-dependent oxidoreductase [Saprospiraceae bacterium]
MKRREFLKKTSLAYPALAAVGTSEIFIQKTPPVKSVIIIGSGLAGLSATRKLLEKGIKVTILEARNRAGGRVFSHKPTTAPGNVIELGAEWVGASHESLIALCNEFKLELVDNRFQSDVTINGQHAKAGAWKMGEQAEKFWENKTSIWEAMTEAEKNALDKTDWWRILTQRGFNEKDLAIRELLDSTDFGESIRHVSGYAAFAEYAESSPNNEMDLKIRGGNSMLIDKMVEAIGADKILLNHQVKNISQDKGVKVSCENGKTFQADRLICTAPTWSLMQINWMPVLSARYLEALNALQYARIGKFPMVFSEKFWEREDFDMVTDTPAHYFYHGTKDQNTTGGVLICYATGDKADVLASVSKDQRRAIILDALKPAFGDVSKYVNEELMYYWGQDAFSRGAYAFYGKNQWLTLRMELGKPQGLCHFAGEHLADWQGFMEGAINSGEEAATQILAG